MNVANQAVCDGSSQLRADHAAALAEDAGPKSLRTGARLVMTIDAACN